MEKEKKKMEKKKKGKEREIRSVDFAAVTAAGRARAPVGRGARDEEEQGDGTAVGYRD